MKHYITIAAMLCTLSSQAFASDDSWLESYNRTMFDFNMNVDKYLMKPVAKGYRAITTQDMRNRVTSFVSNMNEPVSTINHTLQGGFKKTLVSAARFAINSTLGLAGTFDVADGWGLKKSETGFDDTLAYYCVPDGPFVIIPLFGPFTIRSGIGYAADSVSTPIYWGALNDKNYSAKISYGYAALATVNSRERGLDLLDDLQSNSVDFYSTVRSAYLQNRQKMTSLCQSSETTPSYDFDFEAEDFED